MNKQQIKDKCVEVIDKYLEFDALSAENKELRQANAELVEAFKELYLCFKTYNDESEVAQRILAKFLKYGGNS